MYFLEGQMKVSNDKRQMTNCNKDTKDVRINPGGLARYSPGCSAVPEGKAKPGLSFPNQDSPGGPTHCENFLSERLIKYFGLSCCPILLYTEVRLNFSFWQRESSRD